MSRRTHALARGGRIFLVLALLGALLVLPSFPADGGMVPANPAACGAMAPAAHQGTEAAPCPGCCVAGAVMSCCVVSRHGDAPVSLPSSRIVASPVPGQDIDLPGRPFLSLLAAGFPRNGADALSSRWLAAATPLRPRSPAQQRAWGCLWLI